MIDGGFDYKQSLEFLERKEKAEQAENRQRFLCAEKDCNAIIEMIKQYNQA